SPPRLLEQPPSLPHLFPAALLTSRFSASRRPCARLMLTDSKRKPAKLTRHEPKEFFPCTMGCTMRFSRKHDRMWHEITQHGRVCEWDCAARVRGFSSKRTLKNHKC
ncbi:hypothetical protein DFH09DRAFT_832199, partial [Mycena vulgaris]